MQEHVAFSFYALEKTRENLIKAISQLSLDQANLQPAGFNNTPAWNFCHPIVTTHLLTLGLAGLDTGLSTRELAKFRKGSSGNMPCTQEEIDRFTILASSSLDTLKTAYLNGDLKEFQAYETSYGVKLNSIEEALHFVGVHEALHLGYLMAQKRALDLQMESEK
ncbi:MAG: DinB family protein [Bacteroidia bacterium]